MSEQYANLATSTLASGINNSVTTVNVATGEGSKFPSSGNYRIRIESEIMICTGRSGDGLTVTRGQEGSTAASHSSGLPVELVLTRQSLLNLAEYYNLTPDTFANRPSASIAGRIFIPTDTPWITKCYDTGSAWRNFYHGFELTPPPTSSWTWRNQSGGVRTDEKDSILVETNDAGTASTKRLLYRALANSSNYTIVAGFTAQPMPRFTDSQVQSNTVGLLQTSDFKSAIFAFNGPNNSVSVGGLYYINGDDSFNSFQVNSQNTAIFPSVVWFLKIVDDGTNRKWYLSFNGIDFSLLGSVSRTSFITPTSFLFGGHQYLSTVRLIHYKET
jgi:hypothetical protein